MTRTPDALGLVATVGIVIFSIFAYNNRYREERGLASVTSFAIQVAAGPVMFLAATRLILGGRPDTDYYHALATTLSWRELWSIEAPGVRPIAMTARALYTFLPKSILLSCTIFSLAAALARLRLAHAARNQPALQKYVLWSPVLIFFTSSLGKDALVLAALAFVALSGRGRSRMAAFTALILVRPHAALLASPLLLRRGPTDDPMSGASRIAAAALISIPLVLSIQAVAGINDASAESVVERLEAQRGFLQTGTTVPAWYAALPTVARAVFVPLRPLPGQSLLLMLGFADALVFANAILRSNNLRWGLRSAAWPGATAFTLLCVYLAYLPNEGLLLRQKSMLIPVTVAVAADLHSVRRSGWRLPHEPRSEPAALP